MLLEHGGALGLRGMRGQHRLDPHFGKHRQDFLGSEAG